VWVAGPWEVKLWSIAACVAANEIHPKGATMNNRTNTVVNTAQNASIDWHSCWSDFAEGMRQMSESIEAMEKIYRDTFVWDRPIER
jgi:hypothetical protein